MADESIGYYWTEAAKEKEAMEAHDRTHVKDPTYYWGECDICAERVDADIEAGARCKHGEAVGDCGPCEVGMQMAIDRSIEADAFPNK